MLLHVLLLVSVALVVPRSQLVVDAAVNYYVTPSEPITSQSQDCPGEICHTLDEYASNISEYFTGRDNVTMFFMGGVHRSNRCFNISLPMGQRFDLAMLRYNDNSVEIQLFCDFRVVVSIDSLAMSDLVINGNQKFGFVLSGAPVREMTINHVTFVGAALSPSGQLSSTITIVNSSFIGSRIEMEFTFSGAKIFILQSDFESGVDQNSIISLTLARGSASLFIDGLKTSSLSNVEQSAHHHSHNFKDYSALVADIAIDLSTSSLNMTVVNSTFGRGRGTAIHYQLGTTYTGTSLESTMRNCSFYRYDHGAVVLKFTQLISVYMTIENTTFANNTYTDTDGGASGVQIIYPLQGDPPNWLYTHVVTFRECVFQYNENQVVLLYKSKNVTFVDCTFEGNNGTSIVAFHTKRLLFSGTMYFISNSAYRGAGLVLTESTLYIDYNTFVTFYGNTASNKGGAILVEGRENPSGDDPDSTARCFYQILRQDETQKFQIKFIDNFALAGGSNIYGSPLASYCISDDHNSRSIEELESHMFIFHPNNISSISSDPKRVCICDDSGVPRCDDVNNIFLTDYVLFPGESFYLSLVVVGVEFGTVRGEVQANLVESDGFVLPDFQFVTNITQCTKLNFSVHHNSPSQVRMYLTIQDRYAPYYNRDVVEQAIKAYSSSNVIPTELLNVPIIIDISLLPCPTGFVLVGNPPVCDCYPQISEYVTCEILNGTGFMSRQDEVWIGIDNNDNNTVFSTSCPFEHCNYSSTVFDIMQPDDQCVFHHAGQLCGGCADGYSLAIGSTHCLRCPNNGYLSLILFFIVAGPVLVLFIHLLNLTVTQGTLNAIVLYVNIVWTYQQLLFPRRSMVLPPLRIFLAWFNLDFGIESCFVDGLDAFWKTWLQFVFPLYVWTIAGTIIHVCRHSIRLTNMIGERAVPLLATLFLMSYLKLLRIILDICIYTTLTVYPSDSRIVVWSLDGNYRYGNYPHIFLLLAAIATLLLLHLPYTLTLFTIQWLRRISHLRLFKWVTKLQPIFDAHLAPVKDKHHYWFGVLLILRGVLLITFTLTAAQLPALNLLILLIAMTILFFYMLYFQLYKSQLVLLLESLAFMNLIIVAGGSLYIMSAIEENKQNNMAALVNVSIAIIVIQFFGVMLMHIWKTLKERCLKKPYVQRDYVDIQGSSSETSYKDDEFRESILADDRDN